MRKTAILASYILAAALMSFSAYADVISDVPVEIGAAPAGEAVPADPGVSAADPVPAQSSSAGFIDIDSSALNDLPAAAFSAPSDNGAVQETESSGMTDALLESAAPAEDGIVVSEASEAAQPGSGSGSAPAEVSTAADTAEAGTADTEYTAPVQYVTVGGSVTGSLTGPSQISSSGSTGVSVPAGDPGSRYASEAKSSIDLGYTLVSPNVDYNGFKVAEGSAQLSDGSWEAVGKNQYLRNRYYKLISEQTDTSGTGWYVVAAGGRQVGNYRTSDGSVLSEIWLRKSDCTAQSYIELNTSNPTRQQIVRNALACLGKRYVFAANGPDAFDCSGFVCYIMKSVGISVPRSSSEICGIGTQISADALRPGDIVGRPGHVGIYIGDGWFVHASESSTGVITESLAIYNRTNHFSNYINVVGD